MTLDWQHGLICLFLRPTSRTFSIIASMLVLPMLPLAYGAEAIDFNRDVRPILSQHCTACHGGVKAASELSFAYRDSALSSVQPGDPENSELLRRVKSTDPEEVMPKPEHGPRLSDAEIGILQQWIADGAVWSDNWSSVLPRKYPLPEVKNLAWTRGSVDQFVLARLESEGLAPSSEATPAEWLRRVSLDLIGLPPTLEQWEEFQRDWRVDAVAAREKVVERLLASKHFGERWGAMWLDLARYSDTFGFEKDPHRDIWQWRDWVIQAFNRDVPFDDFTIKQLAGDLLENPEPGDLIATAFHRNTQCNTEGGTDDEEFRLAAVIDRVNTTWVAWQATTFGCVRCHAHPYEPYPHESYYQFMALFNSTDDCDQNDDYPHTRVARDMSQQADIVRLEREIRELRQSLNRAGRSLAEESQEWHRWQPAEVVTTGGELSETNAGEFRAGGTLPIGVAYTITSPAVPLTAIRLQIVPEADDPAKLPERGAVLSHIIATIILENGERQPVGLKEVVADSLEGPYDAQSSLVDDAGGFGGYPVLRGPRWAVIVPEVPLMPPAGARLELVLRQSAASNSGVQACTLRRFTLEYSNNQRWSEWSAAEGRRATWDQVQRANEQLQAIPATLVPVVRGFVDGPDRTTRIFLRGNALTKGELVEPGLPDVFQFPPVADRSINRLDYARWLVSPDNPLTARVLANRLWAELFGHGIVVTLEDFGSSGSLPSHPELLDHLALKLMGDYDWSVKRFLRELVLSATYSQASRGSEENRQRDPENRLYGRGPRVRLTAEMVRDQALVVSGLFAEKQFGPPVFPPQPEGVWSTVYSGATWQTATAEDRYRRAIYTYCRRTSGYPAMLAFDAPSRDVCAARRIPTNTPLQALVTLNDPAFMEMAQAFAERMAQSGTIIDDQIRFGYRTLMLDEPDGDTVEVLKRLYTDACMEYQQTLDDAKKLADTPERAALVLVANTLLNLDVALVR